MRARFMYPFVSYLTMLSDSARFDSRYRTILHKLGELHTIHGARLCLVVANGDHTDMSVWKRALRLRAGRGLVNFSYVVRSLNNY